MSEGNVFSKFCNFKTLWENYTNEERCFKFAEFYCYKKSEFIPLFKIFLCYLKSSSIFVAIFSILWGCYCFRCINRLCDNQIAIGVEKVTKLVKLPIELNYLRFYSFSNHSKSIFTSIAAGSSKKFFHLSVGTLYGGFLIMTCMALPLSIWSNDKPIVYESRIIYRDLFFCLIAVLLTIFSGLYSTYQSLLCGLFFISYLMYIICILSWKLYLKKRKIISNTNLENLGIGELTPQQIKYFNIHENKNTYLSPQMKIEESPQPFLVGIRFETIEQKEHLRREKISSISQLVKRQARIFYFIFSYEKI